MSIVFVDKGCHFIVLLPQSLPNLNQYCSCYATFKTRRKYCCETLKKLLLDIKTNVDTEDEKNRKQCVILQNPYGDWVNLR